MNSTIAALPDWARAHGDPLFIAVLRTVPADFQVVEDLGVEFSGEGEHDCLRIEKTAANTSWVAQKLAEHAGVRPVDVGFSGRKDRHAITAQTFSVRRPDRDGTDWNSFREDGVRILEQRRHHRKLKRGTHCANHFRIALRSKDIAPVASFRKSTENRLLRIAVVGVPNYFGEQRFGRAAGNIELARQALSGRRMRRDKRNIAISAARSLLFNEVLSARVRAANWNTIIQGELANLDGTGSVFAVDKVSDELQRRCAEFDIHPTASLWGAGAPLSDSDAAAIERIAASDHEDLASGLINARIAASSRPLRLKVSNLKFEFGDDVLWLNFKLAKGGYATAVLREIARTG